MGIESPFSRLNRSILLAALLGTNVVTIHCSNLRLAAYKRDLTSAFNERTFKYVAPDIHGVPKKSITNWLKFQGHNTTSSHMLNTAEQQLQKAEPPKHARRASGEGGWIQVVCVSVCVLIVLFVFGREAVIASFGHAPHIDNVTVDVGRHGVQLAFLGWWVLLMMDSSMLVPTLHELAQTMHSSAGVSRYFVGCGYLTSALGSIGGAILYKKLSHRICRVVALVGIFLLMAGNLIMAVALDSADIHGGQTMWFLIMLRLVFGLGKLAFVCQFMAYNITPHSDKTTLSLLVVVATNLGLCLGPCLTASTIHMQGGTDVISSVYSRTSPQIYTMAVLWAFLLMTCTFCIPTDLQKFMPEPSHSPRDHSSPRTVLVALAERKAMVAYGILLAIWHSLSSGAIEAGSAMLLQTQLQWGSRAIGFSISAVFGVTVVTSIISIGLLRHGLMKDETGLVKLAGIACSGTFLLFDNGSGMQILLASALVYPFMYCASGIADGIVTKNVVPDSWFSLESYLGAKSAIVELFRFIAFPLARYTIEVGGRNHYGVLLWLLAAAAFSASWKIAGLRQADAQKSEAYLRTLCEPRVAG